MEPFTEPLEPSKSLSINFSEKDLIEIYNHVPQVLLNKIIKVSITENDSLFLREERNGNYWVIKTELGIYWLLPKANFKINIHNINTVKYWFDCQGYQPDDSKEFTLIKLAQVSVVPNKQQWKLEVKGGLNFGNSSLASQLKLELEQTKEEYKQLQSQLNQSTLECFDFKCQIQKLYQERELLLSELEQADIYQQEVLSHLVTREELQKSMQEAAEHFEVITEYLFEDKIQNLLKILNYEIFRIEKAINIDNMQKIIIDYNSNPKQFGQSSLEVGITEKTISNERLGSQEKIIFQIQKRGTYWVVEVSGYFYLVINNNIKIDQFKSNYIKKVFDCYQEKDNQDYNNFKLLKPAKVLKLNQGGELFQLEQKGILEFY